MKADDGSRDARSDDELVRAIDGGDIGAFEVLYRRHRDWVVRRARHLCGQESDALDVLQETFAYLLGKFPGFRLRSRMTTFLHPVIRHLSLDAIARRRRHQGRDVQEEDRVTDPGPGAGDERDELAVALASLSPEHREVILLRHVDDLTVEEIARMLEIPAGTVKSRLHHAHARLRENPRLERLFHS